MDISSVRRNHYPTYYHLFHNVRFGRFTKDATDTGIPSSFDCRKTIDEIKRNVKAI
ncbi:MAG: hypothetical protein WCS17_03365 [Prevotella sp.]